METFGKKVSKDVAVCPRHLSFYNLLEEDNARKLYLIYCSCNKNDCLLIKRERSFNISFLYYHGLDGHRLNTILIRVYKDYEKESAARIAKINYVISRTSKVFGFDVLNCDTGETFWVSEDDWENLTNLEIEDK